MIAETVRGVFIAFVNEGFALHMYILWRQYRQLLRCTALPKELTGLCTSADYKKSRTYVLDRIRFAFIRTAVQYLVIMVLLFRGLVPWLWIASQEITSWMRICVVGLSAYTECHLSVHYEAVTECVFSIRS